jgi:hypothetical protein
MELHNPVPSPYSAKVTLQERRRWNPQSFLRPQLVRGVSKTAHLERLDLGYELYPLSKS